MNQDSSVLFKQSSVCSSPSPQRRRTVQDRVLL